MIKNIVFDIGNVLLDFKPREYLEKKGLGISTIDEVMSCIFNSREWLELDRGSIEVQEAIDNFINSAPKLRDNIIEVMNDWTSMLRPKADTIELLYILKDMGYKIFLLSNFHEEAFKVVLDKYTFISEVDGYVISWEHKCIKPQKDIYLKLMNKYSLKGEETLFIDDVKDNVQGAEVLGIKGVIFTGVNELKKQLKQYEIIV